MKPNKLKIHVQSGNIYHNNTNTNESINSFSEAQENKTIKQIDFEVIISDDFNDYFSGIFDKY